MKENNPVLIVENATSGLEPKNESSKSKDEYILGGVFTEFDVKNRNDRIYDSKTFLPHLDELKERKQQLGVLYGEFDHPEVFDTSLARVSHSVESMEYNQQKNRVEGTIKLLNTHWGKEAKALVEDGYPIFVSSRAAGVTESNGSVNIKRLFTYDAVADPGFSSAKMEMKSLNESFGFNESANFRIFDMSDDTKFNQYFMEENNNNPYVTKQQLTEYSNYLTDQIKSIQQELNNNVNEKSSQEVNQMAELLENLQTQQKNVEQYLDYLAEKVQIVVNENNSLKEETQTLKQHNDYLAENLESSIQYSNYLAEKLDKNISYSEYIAENLDSSIDETKSLNETLEKTIEYSNYLAENIDKTIDYSEYIAENLDNNIAYSEYIAENVDSNIEYSNYIAENLDKSIKYSEYLAENLDNDIAYSEYIAENVSDVQAYNNYLAESIDTVISTVNENSNVNENIQNNLNFKVGDVEKYYEDNEEGQIVQPQAQQPEESDDEQIQQGPQEPQTQQEEPAQGQEEQQAQQAQQAQEEEGQEEDQEEGQEEPSVQGEPSVEPSQTSEEGEATQIVPGTPISISTENDMKTGTVAAYDPRTGTFKVNFDEEEGEYEHDVHESKVQVISGTIEDSEKDIQKSVEKLITEAKKRKASEEEEPHFFKFLTEKNKKYFNELSQEDKEKVTYALNESKYFSEQDVIRIMNEALTVKKSFEEELIENIPSDVKPTYESLEDKHKNTLITQAKMYPNLNTPKKMEAFWRSRNLDQYLNVNEKKKVLNESKNVDNSTLTQDQIDSYINEIKNL